MTKCPCCGAELENLKGKHKIAVQIGDDDENNN